MKKTYSKPEIVFENFTLSTNIAANCDIIISTSTSGTCGLNMGPVTIFLSGISACTKPVSSDDGSSGYCYDIPNGNNDLFNS